MAVDEENADGALAVAVVAVVAAVVVVVAISSLLLPPLPQRRAIRLVKRNRIDE